MANARKTADEKADEQDKDQARLEQLTLRAPIAARVQALSVTNPGQVVTTGQEVMRLVPADSPLEVLAYITNEDIGFMHKGQTAVIKVDSFPFTRFGTIDAEITSIAYDALPADQANHAVVDASKQNQETQMAPTATPMTNLVFEATLQMKNFAITAAGYTIPLTPGMTVTTEIRTGKRSVISYLMGSLIENTQEALHER